MYMTSNDKHLYILFASSVNESSLHMYSDMNALDPIQTTTYIHCPRKPMMCVDLHEYTFVHINEHKS